MGWPGYVLTQGGVGGLSRSNLTPHPGWMICGPQRKAQCGFTVGTLTADKRAPWGSEALGLGHTGVSVTVTNDGNKCSCALPRVAGASQSALRASCPERAGMCIQAACFSTSAHQETISTLSAWRHGPMVPEETLPTWGTRPTGRCGWTGCSQTHWPLPPAPLPLAPSSTLNKVTFQPPHSKAAPGPH